MEFVILGISWPASCLHSCIRNSTSTFSKPSFSGTGKPILIFGLHNNVQAFKLDYLNSSHIVKCNFYSRKRVTGWALKLVVYRTGFKFSVRNRFWPLVIPCVYDQFNWLELFPRKQLNNSKLKWSNPCYLYFSVEVLYTECPKWIFQWLVCGFVIHFSDCW